MEDITIKRSWNEVTIKEFLALQELDPTKFEVDIDYYVEVLSILSGKNGNCFLNMPAQRLPKMISALSFITTQPHGELSASYDINGKKYNAVTGVKDLTAIQYIDLTTLLNDNEGGKNMHRILAVLLTEDGRRYNAPNFDFDAAADEILTHFNIADAHELSLFFSAIFNALTKITRNSLDLPKAKKPRKRMPWKLAKHSASDGDGYTT